MNELRLVHLSEIEEQDIIELMNNESVAEHMPLLVSGFSSETCRAFLRTKQQLWDDHGFGPWAFLINGEFAGWGGLQPEQGEADFALVLHPRFWGWGQRIFKKVRDLAFDEMHLDSITVLFPPTRKNSKTITRFGFVEDSQLTIDGKSFKRFRLSRQPR